MASSQRPSPLAWRARWKAASGSGQPAPGAFWRTSGAPSGAAGPEASVDGAPRVAAVRALALDGAAALGTVNAEGDGLTSEDGERHASATSAATALRGEGTTGRHGATPPCGGGSLGYRPSALAERPAAMVAKIERGGRATRRT